MEERIEKLLRDSIAKWERNTEVKDLKSAKIGPDSCPLCVAFNHEHLTDDSKCEGCPIYERLGARFCKGTPYDNCEMAYYTDNLGAFLKFAAKELAFLKRLLPEGSA